MKETIHLRVEPRVTCGAFLSQGKSFRFQFVNEVVAELERSNKVKRSLFDPGRRLVVARTLVGISVFDFK